MPWGGPATTCVRTPGRSLPPIRDSGYAAVGAAVDPADEGGFDRLETRIVPTGTDVPSYAGTLRIGRVRRPFSQWWCNGKSRLRSSVVTRAVGEEEGRERLGCPSPSRVVISGNGAVAVDPVAARIATTGARTFDLAGV